MGFEFGLYVEGHSFMHRLDPRVKLIFALSLVFLPAFYKDPKINGSIYGVFLLLTVLSRVGLKRLFIVLSISSVIFFMTFLIWATSPLVSGGRILLVLYLPWGGPVTYTELGVLYALNNVFLILIPVSGMFLYVSVTKPYEIVQSFQLLRLPFKIGFAFSTALRFLPVMFNDTKQIMEAQMSRGLDLQGGNILRRIRGYIPIFIPLLVKMMKGVQELSLSLETRCFGVTPKRSFVEEARLKLKDYVAIVILFSVIAFSIYAKIVGIGQSLT
jgi:energy-coupling factor transport system permease protein